MYFLEIMITGIKTKRFFFVCLLSLICCTVSRFLRRNLNAVWNAFLCLKLKPIAIISKKDCGSALV